MKVDLPERLLSTRAVELLSVDPGGAEERNLFVVLEVGELNPHIAPVQKVFRGSLVGEHGLAVWRDDPEVIARLATVAPHHDLPMFVVNRSAAEDNRNRQGRIEPPAILAKNGKYRHARQPSALYCFVGGDLKDIGLFAGEFVFGCKVYPLSASGCLGCHWDREHCGSGQPRGGVPAHEEEFTARVRVAQRVPERGFGE